MISLSARRGARERGSRSTSEQAGADQAPDSPSRHGYTRRVSEENRQLRTARERTLSRRIPGEPMGREELAEAVNAWLWENTGEHFDLDARAIARYERGVVRWPGSHYRAAMRHVLGAPGDAELGFHPSGRATPSAPTPVRSGTPPWLIAGTLTRSSIDATALDQMERAVYGHALRYPSTPPHELWSAVSTLINHLNGVLTHPLPQQLRLRAVVLMGVLTGLAGSLWVDFDRPHDASGYFDVAELAAREADSPDLAAWALATRSVGVFYAGDHITACALLARAEQEAAQAGPRRRAWIAALRARAAAACGDPDGAHRALESARQHIDRATEPGTGTDFFDAARLDGLAGATYLMLRDTTRAALVLRDALTRRAAQDAKGRALLGLDLAECLVHDGEAIEASRVAVEALDWAKGAMVEPIAIRALELRGHLIRLSGPAGAQEFDARLREAVHG